MWPVLLGFSMSTPQIVSYAMLLSAFLGYQVDKADTDIEICNDKGQNVRLYDTTSLYFPCYICPVVCLFTFNFFYSP
jgi:hypothetical protein